MISQQSFLIDLYDEHVEELAALYDLIVYQDPDDPPLWRDAEAFEARIDAHRDALVIGGAAAAERVSAVFGDGPGESYAAMVVLASGNESDRLHELLHEFRPDSLDVFEAISRGLSEYASGELLRTLLQPDQSKQPTTLAALWLAQQRQNGSPPDPKRSTGIVQSVLAGETEDWVAAVVTDDRLVERQLELLVNEDPAVRRAALSSLLTGLSPVKRTSILNVSSCPEDGLPQWIAGGTRVDGAEIRRWRTKTSGQGYFRALGIHGLPENASILVDALESEAAQAAADALFCLTGAPLYVEKFLPEQPTPDELFPDEVTAWQQGKSPRRADGLAYGQTVSAITTDAPTWKAWLGEHRSAFVAGNRYRYGRLLEPEVLLSVLVSEHSPYWIREASRLELAVRYRTRVAIDLQSSVRRQDQQLMQLRQAISGSQRFIPGRWYLDAELLGA